MSSSSSETEDRGVAAGKEDNGRPEDRDDEWVQQHGATGVDRISEMLGEEIAASAAPARTGNGIHGERYRDTDTGGSDFGDDSPDRTPLRNGSPVDSMLSIPDDTPSVQVGRSFYWGDSS